LIAKSPFLAVLVVGLTLISCGAPSVTGSGVCGAHRRGAAVVSRDVLVYGVRTDQGPVMTYYACRPPAGLPVELGTDELGSVYGSDEATEAFRAAGTYVAAESSTGVATLAVCARYTNIRRCPAAHYWLTVVDTQTRRDRRLPIYLGLPVPALVPFPVTVLLSTDGAVAWLQNVVLGENVTGALQLWATALKPAGHHGLAGTPAIIDSGAIDRSSVGLSGRTLRWIRDGHRQLRRLS